MTQDLITTFGKSDGGTYDWKYKGLDPDLSASEIKNACELLTKLDICTEKGVKLFDSVITAKIVTTKETLMFDPEHETKGLTYYGEPAREASREEVACFEVIDEPKKLEQEALAPPVVPSNQTRLSATPYGRYFKQLTTIEPSENTKRAVKVEKDSLPQPKTTSSEINDQKAHSNSEQLPISPVEADAKERNGLFRWMHRLRKKNKEGPTETLRE